MRKSRCTLFADFYAISYIMSRGNILKDSFYKERLARTSGNIINAHTTNHFAPVQNNEDSDTDAQVISPEEEQLDFQQLLSGFGKTADGASFAFRELQCTHKRLTAIHVLLLAFRRSENTSIWRRWIFHSIV